MFHIPVFFTADITYKHISFYLHQESAVSLPRLLLVEPSSRALIGRHEARQLSTAQPAMQSSLIIYLPRVEITGNNYSEICMIIGHICDYRVHVARKIA